ncbi:MAG TPA: M23 family metallopeptidase [Leptospiraceae bacterium]|nr:M23 family metallopeptidase [Leptospiraceae bacterium]HMY30995.1 M23 family metallopeptidase [Leptospiraceae bacterium]HMZ64391.1 M23 family metallopeptidase [Leptospiraceae bacterium]HNA05635.1 M23 family metallopeptidase [Leptospiraceae bacterium]HNC56119.1 M23 family metallopeptidase [Leptospiraceae bacterium]
MLLSLAISSYSSLFADRKVARLVEPIRKKSPSYASTKPTEIKKEEPKIQEPPKEEITNIERIYEGKEYVVRIRARKFRQGELMFVRLQSNNPNITIAQLQKYNLFWLKKKVEMFVLNNEYMGFIPIHPELQAGTYELEIKTEEVADTYKVCPVEIEATKFKETNVAETLKLPKRFAPKKGGDPAALKFIMDCERLKKTAYQSYSQPMFSQNFHLPAKIKKITSNFYARRNYFTKKGKPHGGIDIRGASGDPIHAIQDGKVVISRPMYFEGIFTVIDHGSKIFSLYMHQSETLVKEGDSVKRGQQIGKIGSTGMSTGPHLHLGLRVDNTLVNPMSIIQLKIF